MSDGSFGDIVRDSPENVPGAGKDISKLDRRHLDGKVEGGRRSRGVQETCYTLHAMCCMSNGLMKG